MKLWEVLKELEENPKKKFEANVTGNRAVMYVDRNYYRIDFFTPYGSPIDENKGGGKFNNNVRLNLVWQEVKQPVTWQEAFEEWLNGRTVFCFLENGKKVEYDQNINFIHAHSLKTGTWYIED